MLADLLGTTGVCMILLAYYLNTTGKLQTTQLAFILLNIAGASMACAASILIDYIPFIILEGTWAVLSVLSLVRYLKTM